MVMDRRFWHFGRPEIFNTERGPTSAAFVVPSARAAVQAGFGFLAEGFRPSWRARYSSSSSRPP